MTRSSLAAPVPTRGSSAAGTRQVRERATQIVEFATDAIISKDRDGLITSWNLGAERLYGYRSEEAVGRPVGLIIPERLKGEELQLLGRVLDGEHIDYYETTRLAKDGRSISVSLTLWNVDPSMVTDYANPSIAKMLGYTVEEMLGRHLSDFLSAPNLNNARASIERQSEGASERVEQTLTCKDGHEIQVLMSVTAVLGENSEQLGNMAIITDVTQQRRTETHLRESETFLAGLTASMQEGLLTLGAGGRIAAVNHAAEHALGYTAEQLTGRTMCSILGCERAREQRCADQSCRLAMISTSREPLRIEDQVFVCADGTSLPVELSAAPIGTEPGGPTGRVVVFRDISERKKASSLAERELEEMSWIGRVRDAMNEDRLVLATQPIVELGEREPLSAVARRSRAGGTDRAADTRRARRPAAAHLRDHRDGADRAPGPRNPTHIPARRLRLRVRTR
jgi:PAS domain S-box-containing protein